MILQISNQKSKSFYCHSVFQIGGLMFVIGFLLLSCSKEKSSPTLFELMGSDKTGIVFENTLQYSDKFNIYRYRNFYNGGGVAIGDLNNDGLPDIYLTANMNENRLYLNKGGFQFEDITFQAGVGGKRGWSAGISLADINGDGFLDIYVCNSGSIDGDDRKNELFINNGDLTFAERAQEYGIDDNGFSIHGVFFDFDKDGDLDLYLVNNSYHAIGSFNLTNNVRDIRDSLGGDKLFRNDNGKFVDISAQAGIYGSVIGFGLGVTVGDFDMDGWLDMYVSNDFFERDYLYHNNGDGTFTESLESRMRSISAASMGADLADINNDGFPDLFVTEMLPKDNKRLKTVTTFESWDRYQNSVHNGYYHQFTRNMLHLNNGNSTFSEIGRFAGVHATDWSWGALMADLDNDGFKDLFVANGIYQDLTNQDYLQFISNEETQRMIIREEGVDYKSLIAAIPSVRVPNFVFRNNGDLTFTDKAQEWGLSEPSHSNGSAYGDLDNDGDLDLVVNNVNMPLFIFKNKSSELLPNQRYINVSLHGKGANTMAIGAKVTIKHGGKQFYLENIPVRGFQSTMDSRLHFGLGEVAHIDSLVVEWPDGNYTFLTKVMTNQHLKLYQEDAQQISRSKPPIENPRFAVINNHGVDFVHTENPYVDFERERLIYHMLSTEGPAMSVGDVNGDGLEDIYIGGAKGFAGSIFLQKMDGRFSKLQTTVFENDKQSEDVDSEFFDADGDGYLDLYVASGGSEYASSSFALADRLYINDGNGNFSKSDQILPASKFESTACVRSNDYDGDGDLDLFVGIRLRPYLYGVPVNGYILNNDGKGVFTDLTSDIAPDLIELGMITDAVWTDIDSDGDDDLIIVGEYMPVKVFLNEGGKFIDFTGKANLSKTNGWWNCIAVVDLDQDGDIDLVIGNHGLNSRFHASVNKPVSMYINDFDGNGTAEQIICVYNGDTSYPLALKHDLVRQLPALSKKYVKYESYGNETIEDIFTPDQLEKSIRLDAYNFESSIFINNGDGTFDVRPLPDRAQFSPVYAIHFGDFNSDGFIDLILGGNLAGVKPEVGKYDANYGLVLKGAGSNHYIPLSIQEAGIQIEGDVRQFRELNTGSGKRILIAKNNDSVQIISY